MHVLELEDKIKQQEDQIKSMIKYYTERESEFKTKIRSVEGNLSLQRNKLLK